MFMCSINRAGQVKAEWMPSGESGKDESEPQSASCAEKQEQRFAGGHRALRRAVGEVGQGPFAGQPVGQRGE